MDRLWMAVNRTRGTSAVDVAIVREQCQEQRRGCLRSLSDDLNPTGIKLLQWALRASEGEMRSCLAVFAPTACAADRYVRSL